MSYEERRKARQQIRDALKLGQQIADIERALPDTDELVAAVDALHAVARYLGEVDHETAQRAVQRMVDVLDQSLLDESLDALELFVRTDTTQSLEHGVPSRSAELAKC